MTRSANELEAILPHLRVIGAAVGVLRVYADRGDLAPETIHRLADRLNSAYLELHRLLVPRAEEQL